MDKACSCYSAQKTCRCFSRINYSGKLVLFYLCYINTFTYLFLVDIRIYSKMVNVVKCFIGKEVLVGDLQSAELEIFKNLN